VHSERLIPKLYAFTDEKRAAHATVCELEQIPVRLQHSLHA
jgi:hypothetical protein